MSKTYTPISQRKTADELLALVDTVRSARARKEIDWKLNLAYFRGNQYVYWNPAAKRVESVPTEDGEKPRYRVRIVSNQVVTGTQSLLSKIIKTKPIFGATPGQPGDKAIKAAEFAEVLLEYWWRDMRLADKYEEAVQWAIHAASGFWMVSWDPYANKAMTFLLDPQGNPITDSAIESTYRAALAKEGIEPQEKTIYLGDLKVDVLSPFHVYGDNAAKSVEEWKWVICQYNLTPDDVKSRYKVDLQPDAQSASPDQMLPMGNAETSGEPNVVKIYIGYFLPTPAMPKGRYVVFTEAGGKQILYDGPWPWVKLVRLPIVQFAGIKVPGQAEGDALTTHARPLQKQLNRMLSQVTEYFNMTIKPRVWAPVGSMRTRLTNEPGAVYEYNPVAVGTGALKPEIETLPSIPPYVFEFLKDIGGRLREVYGLTEVTEGTLPPNLEAADAIDLLQEMATDRFAPAIQANERSLAQAGQLMLDFAQVYYQEPRLLAIRGFGGAGSVREFTKADIAGGVTIHVEAGSSMPKTKAARRKQIEKWIEMGLLDPKKAWRHYDLADIKDLAQQFALDDDQVMREHEKLIAQEPLNIPALRGTIQQMQAQPPVDPETGEPLPPEAIQDILRRAALSPTVAENLSTHIEKHGQFMKSLEFESLDPQVQSDFIQHYEMTVEKMQSIPDLGEPQSPRVSLQIKGAAGPTTMAAILKRAGVPEADAEVIGTEPPMETMVIDSVDKPDADAGSPGQEAEHLSAVAQAMVQADLANATAQLQNAQSQEKHSLKQQHDDEMHQAKVRRAHADADLAEKKSQTFQPPSREAKTKPKKK